jgi:DNA-binding SARP family transcriptional activator
MITADPLEFSLLGPLTVRRGGTPVDLGARQQRLMLALLLSAGGTLIGMTELIDLLWGQEAPPSAANVVHRNIGVLRRTLEPGLPTRSPGRFLIRQVSGYQLRVDESTLDLLEFRRLAGSARGHAEAGEDSQAVQLFLRGLRLWRGRCAAGLEPVPATHPAFAAVEAERTRAVRDAADAATRSGRPTAVLPALRTAAELHPLDEALQSRLLLALAADGQPAAAVTLFQQLRRRLDDELGIDPGAELRAAYEQVAGRRSAAGPPGPALPTPAQLPPDLSHFSGREALLDRMTGLAGVLTVDGMPGVGKTALAVHLAHRLAPDYPDGQLYADLRGFDEDSTAMSPAEALRGFLSSLGIPPGSIPGELHAQAGLFRSALAGRRMLILLDNCRDVEQVKHLIPGTPGCLVLVTSRNRLGGLVTATGAHPVTVEPPDHAEARAGVVRRLGAARVATAPAAVDDIIAACGRLPLALAVVCARAATQPGLALADLAADLRRSRGTLDGFTGDDPQTDLRTVFSWSYRTLSAAAARLFVLLPTHPGTELTVAAAAWLAGVPLRDGRALLGELTRAHLLTEQLPGRYQLHDLVHSYATELGEADHRSPVAFAHA